VLFPDESVPIMVVASVDGEPALIAVTDWRALFFTTAGAREITHDAVLSVEHGVGEDGLKLLIREGGEVVIERPEPADRVEAIEALVRQTIDPPLPASKQSREAPRGMWSASSIRLQRLKRVPAETCSNM
jgi:hypothetical protein